MEIFECTRNWCAADELDQLWRVKDAIIEEVYQRLVELRGIDVGHKVLQIFADSLEVKGRKNGEDRACRGRETSAFQIRAKFGGFKCERKFFEAGQCGKGGVHRVG